MLKRCISIINMVLYSWGGYVDKDYIVTKSNKLIACNYDLSLQEQKIILTLASMVQPQDTDFKPYIFKINEFMELLNVKDKSKYVEIPKITKVLMQKVFELKQENKILQLAWLSSAEYEKGTGTIELEFSPKLKTYMLGLQEFYTSYKLVNILSLKSKYSIRLYEILKSNLYKKCIEIEIEELKKMLYANEKSYNVYQNVKNKVIIQAQKELKNKTDISFDFTEIKTGRKVTSIKFYIKENKALNEITIGLASSEVAATEESIPSLDIKEVQTIFTKHNITELEAIYILKDSNGNLDLIKQCYEYASNKNINNVVGYIRKLVKGFNKPQMESKKDSFNDYEQRIYDFDDLEKKLLGLE